MPSTVPPATYNESADAAAEAPRRARTMPTVTLLEAHDLRFRRGDRDVITGADLVLRAGERVALIGANGSGKSTLLELLAGELVSEHGVIRRAPGVQVAFAGQSIETPPGLTLRLLAEGALGPLRELEQELERAAGLLDRSGDDAATSRYLDLLALFEERDGFTAHERLRAALARLGLGDEVLEREASACSGGERRRALLAGVLTSGAEVVLLDEPTNHLDLPARAALTDALLAHRGAVVFASHDRALLDAVSTHVVRLARGRIDRRRGTYASVQRDRAADARASIRATRERAKRAAELERMAAELARHGQAAHTRRRRAQRELATLTGPPQDGTRAAAATAGTAALATSTGTVRGELVRGTHLRAEGVMDDASVRITRGERIAVVGPSGSGKSTLLSLVSGERASDDPRSEVWFAPGARLLVLDQVWRGLAPDRSPRQALLEWVGETRALSVLRLVGVPREVWDSAASTLSGGERARTGLALLVVREADVILLDEPTNDLDLPTIETLEATLVAADAAIVVATHDERLVEALGAEVWAVEEGELVRYRGGVDGYRRGARRRERGLDAASADDESVRAGVTAATAVADAAHDPVADTDLDAALAQAEQALLDPTRSSARDLARWRERRRELEARLLERWDATATPPSPRFRTRESGLRVWADRDDDGLYVSLESIDEGPAVRVRRFGSVAHVVAVASADRDVLPWAWRALCHGAARLACYVLGVESVQVATDVDLSGGPYDPLVPGWWVARRDELERREGWRRADARAPSAPAPHRARRRSRRRRAAR